MKQRFAATLASSVLVAVCAGTGALVQPGVNSALDRYPGAQIVREQRLDASQLAHGWLSWHATYETTTTLDTVAVWYAQLLPSAETHTVGQCQVLRQSQAVWHVLRAISVQLCAQRLGTAILVNEDVYLGP